MQIPIDRQALKRSNQGHAHLGASHSQGRYSWVAPGRDPGPKSPFSRHASCKHRSRCLSRGRQCPTTYPRLVQLHHPAGSNPLDAGRPLPDGGDRRERDNDAIPNQVRSIDPAGRKLQGPNGPPEERPQVRCRPSAISISSSSGGDRNREVIGDSCVAPSQKYTRVRTSGWRARGNEQRRPTSPRRAK